MRTDPRPQRFWRLTSRATAAGGPGLILPAGAAAGTADSLGFAMGGGTGLLLNIRNGPGQDAVHTAPAITTRLGACLARAGWAAQG